MSSHDDIEHSLAQIRTRFVHSLAANYSVISALDIEVKNSSATIEMVADVYVITHKITGVAATLGMPILGEKANRLEAELSRLLETDRLPSDVRSLSEKLTDIILQIKVVLKMHPDVEI